MRLLSAAVAAILVPFAMLDNYCSYDTCQCSANSKELTCRGAGFTRIPAPLPASLEKLDLATNNMSDLGEAAFAQLPNLTELILTDNLLEEVHAQAFLGIHHLKKLALDQNQISELPDRSLEGLEKLEVLQLGANKLQNVPYLPLRALRELSLASNLLTDLSADTFPYLQNLTKLILKRNQIASIDDNAFVNLSRLRVLELDDNALPLVPVALTQLPALQELSLSGNKIKFVPGNILQRSPGLFRVELRGNPIVGMDQHAFAFLPNLRKLILSDTRHLTRFPVLNGTSSLEELYLDRSSLSYVPSSLCRDCPRLRSLVMKSNNLTRIPDLDSCTNLRLLDLGNNWIDSLEGRSFRNLARLHDLMLPFNMIPSVPEHAFQGLAGLQRLDLQNNHIMDIHSQAFLAFTMLQDLNLGNNTFPTLPAQGMEHLLHLKAFNNPNLREFPAPANFPQIQTLVLSYAYHCCAFMEQAEPQPQPTVVETIIFPEKDQVDMSVWNSSSTDMWPQMHNMSRKFGTQMNHIWDKFGSDFTYPGSMPTEEYFEEQEGRPGGSDTPPKKVQCLPLSGPFLPCRDLFDWWTLRCGVWIVFLLAMLGNGTVVFVLIFSRSKMDVPRFLVCNLAAADFFMGIYLGFLAVLDVATLGDFRMYAIRWQMSAGCQLAGFLGVLSAELSVYTLAVITLERNYAITHAMHLNKRLSLKHAGYIMACGWSFALLMALLPLFGVSDYRKFAICLPFETTTGIASLTYVVFLMFINGVAFLILMGCYLKMYCAIRGSQAWNSNDSRIAKRMALLVFTDFICWSPIAFFSLTAAFGLQLISLEQAKVFTVFVLPLNSCCNPFLYAILTKQFKKDCVLICKAIEESRVTRGIGRCRHSSNFSNRQTPANTNSLVDRSSREHPHHAQPCTCNSRLLGESGTASSGGGPTTPRLWLLNKAQWLLLCLNRNHDTRHRTRSDQYAYQIAEIQQKQHKRASSVSSSENFSSSRSDSWRQTHHHCGIPLRLLDPKRRASSWLVTRKTSQDSNLSSSRNDSSGSATTASTSTWRMSRSSASSAEPPRPRAKPRLTRQSAVQDDAEPPGSPSRLTVRFLTTIPSAAETSVQLEEDPTPYYAILHSSPPHTTIIPSPPHADTSHITIHTSPHPTQPEPSNT